MIFRQFIELNPVHRFEERLDAIYRFQKLESRVYGFQWCIRAIINTKNRHQTVTDKLVDEAVISLDDVPNLHEITIEEVHDVVR